MQFIFFTNVSFEDWDYDNGIRKGIGGAETSIVEMSWRLAREGHDVTVYAPIKKTTKPVWRGVKWKRYESANFKEDGVWILYRCPEMIDKFKGRQKPWHLWQDWDYPQMNKDRIKGAKHITLCKAHGRYMMERYPGIKPWISSNGIKRDLIEEVESEIVKEHFPEGWRQHKEGEKLRGEDFEKAMYLEMRKNLWRNPYRVMYASSPDRGLKYALQVIKKAREYEPRIEFHAFYGFNNLDKLIKGLPKGSSFARDKDEIMELLKQEGVYFHGRINQKQLMREWFKSNVYLYITNFFETSHISGMEAQACGAIPIFSPIYAQAENLRHGVAVDGPANAELTIARAAGELVKLIRLPAEQAKIREEMMPWARERFDWDVFVEQWILEAENNREGFEARYAFPEQLNV